MLVDTARAVRWSPNDLIATSDKLKVVRAGRAIAESWLNKARESGHPFYLDLVVKDQLTARQLTIGLDQGLGKEGIVLNFLAVGDGTGVASATQTFDYLNEIGVHHGFDLTRGRSSLVAISFTPVGCLNYLGEATRSHHELHVPFWSGEPTMVRETAEKYCEGDVANTTYFNQIWQLVRAIADTDGAINTHELAAKASDALANFTTGRGSSGDIGWDMAGFPGLAYWVGAEEQYHLDPIIRQAALGS